MGKQKVGELAQISGQKKKHAVEVTNTGTGFDKSGKLITPRKTATQILKEQDAKTVAKVEKIAKKAAPKPKKEPLFLRDNTEARDSFIDRALKEIKGLEKVDVKVNNKDQPTEPTLKYKGKLVAWCAPRSGHLWTNYLFFIGQPKEIHKIHNDTEMEADLQSLKEICKAIDELPSQTVKTTKKAGKRRKVRTSSSSQPRDKDSILRQLKKLGNSKGMKVPRGIMPNNNWFNKACNDLGFKINWKNRLVYRA